ncbi:MAG: mandelate racemase/muconate lactonizing enzyme family protein [Maioricimonas sp. JB049]
MTITRIEAFQPVSGNSPPDWRTSLGQIAVRIETSGGLTGYGIGGGGAAGIHIIQSILAPLLTGQSSDPVEDHWQAMYDATLPFGRKGVAIMALSGVDLALWDLRAKAAGQSVVEWLGGRTGQAVPTYATVWDEVDDVTARGGSPVKLHVHPRSEAARHNRTAFIEEIVARTAAAREVIGPQRELMIDAWMEWDVPTTLTIAREIESLRIGWIEEPISPDDLDGYRQLRDECPIPIAGGEHEFTHIGFRPLVEERLHQVLQPDVCWCGGMTELVRIYRMAREAGLRVIPHRGAEVWGLHALAALDPQPLAESGRPWMQWVAGQPPIEAEVIRIPEVPGFGVTLD